MWQTAKSIFGVVGEVFMACAFVYIVMVLSVSLFAVIDIATYTINK